MRSPPRWLAMWKSLHEKAVNYINHVLLAAQIMARCPRSPAHRDLADRALERAGETSLYQMAQLTVHSRRRNVDAPPLSLTAATKTKSYETLCRIRETCPHWSEMHGENTVRRYGGGTGPVRRFAQCQLCSRRWGWDPQRGRQGEWMIYDADDPSRRPAHSSSASSSRSAPSSSGTTSQAPPGPQNSSSRRPPSSRPEPRAPTDVFPDQDSNYHLGRHDMSTMDSEEEYEWQDDDAAFPNDVEPPAGS